MSSKTEMKKLPYIIAIDFDGTLVTDEFPAIGKPTPLMEVAKVWMGLDVKLVLWTCRDGERLQDAVRFCTDNGLYFDSINKNIPEVIEMFGGDTRKVFADIYIDDKAVEPVELVAKHLGVLDVAIRIHNNK